MFTLDSRTISALRFTLLAYRSPGVIRVVILQTILILEKICFRNSEYPDYS